MKKIKRRNKLMVTFLRLTVFLLFSMALCAEKRPEKESTTSREKTYSREACSFKPIVWQPTVRELPNKETIDQKYMAVGQTIKEEDVLYLSVYTLSDVIQFVDENREVHSNMSCNFSKTLAEKIKKKKLIWVYFIQTFQGRHKNIEIEPTIKNLLEDMMKDKNIVLDHININQYKLLANPKYKLAGYINKLRKLAAVWLHALSDQVDGPVNSSTLILYNPISNFEQSYIYTKERTTLLFYVFNMFWEISNKFKKTFIIMGFLDKESREEDPGINAQEAEISLANGVHPYLLYSMIRYKLKLILKNRERNSFYLWTKMHNMNRNQYIEYIKGNPRDSNEQALQSLSKSNIEYTSMGIPPICFIWSSFQSREIRDIAFDIYLSMFPPHTARMYVNIFTQRISHNRYYIKNYSPVYIDFSFCVLNSLHKDCFREFFSQTEYLLIRDIDCSKLKLLLNGKKIFNQTPYNYDIPMCTQKLAEVAIDPVKVTTSDSNLREACPRMFLPNMVYHIAPHMIFMRSTLQIEVDSEYEKYIVFDVLVTKKDITNTLTVEGERRSELEDQKRKKEVSNALNGNVIFSKKTIYTRDKALEKLLKIDNNSESISIIECCYVDKDCHVIEFEQQAEASSSNEKENSSTRKRKVSLSSDDQQASTSTDPNGHLTNQIDMDIDIISDNTAFFWGHTGHAFDNPATNYSTTASTSATPPDFYTYSSDENMQFMHTASQPSSNTAQLENNRFSEYISKEITHSQYNDIQYGNEPEVPDDLIDVPVQPIFSN
ncbi:hypothetical protein NEFER02_2202 [Nematocida sp. LUAm2]|nr:hypothetical protein NEFER02_0910 [Nematocida sp. LUAm2]KAI5176184.1 hypothetical protein NEFER02_1998 [Nematocida sp. LUAm2]KAI5176447.1 hypothetical protein NEFER02_2202 [Nematocida sp. LUAm2]